MSDCHEPQPQFYLLGASHLTALLRASRAPGDGPALPQFAGQVPAFRPWAVDPDRLPGAWQVASLYIGHTTPFWGAPLVQAQDGGRLGINPGLQTLLRSIAPPDAVGAVVLSLRGEEYYNLAVDAAAHPFDFHLAALASLGCVPGLPVLPSELVQARMAGCVAATLQLLAAVRMFCPSHRLLRLAPPPPPSAATLRDWLARSGRDSHPALALPASVRLKLWTLQARLLAEGSAALGVTTLAVPAAAVDAGGWLREDFMDDPVHGNEAYGALVCRQLADWAQAQLKEPERASV